ncbi:MAG: 1-acyl-sn-glycerol-3-phosphate acyltransferase [Myxococcota bacterium]
MDSPKAPAETPLSGSPRPYEPNALFRWIYRRYFSHITVDEAWSGSVRESARQGVVVYVMRSISFLDFLCLDFLVKRFGLPLVRFVNDLGLWILEPFGKGDRRLRLKRQRPEDEALSEVVEQQHSALLFLRKPPRIGSRARKGEDLQTDLIRTLVETQRRMDKPILLLPQTFVWSQRPPKRRRGFVDMLFGPVEWPGKVRVFLQFLFNYRNARLRSGDAFNLQSFLEEQQDLTDAEIADKIRYALLRRMERERTLVLGPTQKTPTRIQDELLRSPRVRKQIEEAARRSDRSIAKVEKEARKELRKLQARQTPWMLATLSRVLNWVFRRIYDGVVVDREGIERVREAARQGTLIYLPSHKSHVDYLVLSYVLYHHALSAPLIAAGENLGFFPLGPILRRGGAFFIRRSFKGRKLYAALVDAYMRKLIVEGFPIEFFIEGGRSRTGKLLSPKYGLLTMVVDAALKLRMKKVFFVPISIGYERVIEERSYVHELGGGEKQKEDIGGLLKTPQILRSKYGRLYVQFGEILTLEDAIRDFIGEEAVRDRSTITPPKRRALVQRVAHRMTHEIDRATTITPAALVASALLVHQRRGISRRHLRDRARMLLDTLRRMGARPAESILASDGSLRSEALDEAIALFEDAKLLRSVDASGEVIYNVPDQRRLALEYYLNNLVSFFVPRALISAAMRASSDEAPTVRSLREQVRWLSRLFKYEFMFRADAPFDSIFGDALAGMVDDNEVEWTGDTVRFGEAARHLDVYAAMLKSYFEAYLLAVRSLSNLDEDGMSRKEWVRRALALGQRMYLAGELELRESMSKPKLETALKALKDLGFVVFPANDKVARAPEDESAEDDGLTPATRLMMARRLEDFLN